MQHLLQYTSTNPDSVGLPATSIEDIDLLLEDTSCESMSASVVYFDRQGQVLVNQDSYENVKSFYDDQQYAKVLINQVGQIELLFGVKDDIVLLLGYAY